MRNSTTEPVVGFLLLNGGGFIWIDLLDSTGLVGIENCKLNVLLIISC
jgi:hypothetical protein